MEFDKSRVYTAFNAEDLKVGSKCICRYSKLFAANGTRRKCLRLCTSFYRAVER